LARESTRLLLESTVQIEQANLQTNDVYSYFGAFTGHYFVVIN
jgi:hypothetical protein